MTKNLLTTILHAISTFLKNIYTDNKTAIEAICEPEFISESRAKALIADVYDNVPRSAVFIKKCLADGKMHMGELTPEDFDNAINLKGLGSSSVEQLRKVYNDFKSSPVSYSAESENEVPTGYLFNSLSVRATNCLAQAGINSVEDLLALNLKDLWKIRSLGQKTYDEIVSFRKSVSLDESASLENQTYHLDNVAVNNRRIPISLLSSAGLTEGEILLLEQKGFYDVGDLCDCELAADDYVIVQKISKFLSVSVSDQFVEKIDALKESEKICMLRRAEGDTLQEVGDRLGVTRERVRQVTAKTCSKLKVLAELTVASFLPEGKKALSYELLAEKFAEETFAAYCKLILKESDCVIYFKFANKFVYSNIGFKEVGEQLMFLVEDVVGDGINFYDHLELIEEELCDRNLDFFNHQDVMNYLLNRGYHFYGEYVAKGKQAYGNVCCDAIRKYFDFDIKLNSDINNEDMQILRTVIAKHYSGLTLPPNNRALTAAITRDFRRIVLSGRGRYCPVEKIVYSISLFDEVSEFIQESQQTSFYYSELFSHFRERLLSETNIGNHHFVHGMLKYLYPDEFTYERDLLVKNGAARQDVNNRIEQLLLERGCAMTREEIKQEIPGISDAVIAFSVMRLPEIIQWDYSRLNHIRNIHINEDLYKKLRNCIKDLTSAHYGYATDELLFKKAQEECPQLFLSNMIKNSLNLYYIASCLFGDEYRFRRPHIVTQDFPVKELTVSSIIRVLLGDKKCLNYVEYCDFSEKIGWVDGTRYAVFYELERDYIRISENDYILREQLSLSENEIEKIGNIVDKIIGSVGYYAFNSISDYEIFPEFGYAWNGFLLESLIAEYDIGFRVISPQVRDRRYQRGIIVPNSSSYHTFESIVIAILSENGIESISESALEKLLIKHKVIMKTLPQDVYEFSQLLFKNEMFVVK